jgi:hypothetical protein
VQADRALVEFAGIEDTMHGLVWIHGAGMLGIHLNSFGGLDVAFSGSHILLDHAKIFYQQPADRDGHPAVLVPVIVDRARLAGFPANCKQFIERSFIDEVASIVLAVPGEIGSKRIRAERVILQEFAELFRLVECGFRKFTECGDKLVDWDLPGCGGHGMLRKKYSAVGGELLSHAAVGLA